MWASLSPAKAARRFSSVILRIPEITPSQQSRRQLRLVSGQLLANQKKQTLSTINGKMIVAGFAL
jgi:hypothetical protein